MPVEILMPELGESVHEGTVSRWLKKVGEFVKEDEPVVEIMTDKVNTELPAPASGILTKILIPEGEQVEVFHAMGIIESSSSAETEKPSAPAAPAATAESTAATVPAPTEPAVSNGERKWYTPVVKAIAKEQGLTEAQLDSISGSGDGGRVTKKDVEAYLASGKSSSAAVQPQAKKPEAAPVPQPKPVPPTVAGPDQTMTPLVGMRKMIADRHGPFEPGSDV